eukprot:10195-Heterococcus_DN1.PRE.3
MSHASHAIACCAKRHYCVELYANDCIYCYHTSYNTAHCSMSREHDAYGLMYPSAHPDYYSVHAARQLLNNGFACTYYTADTHSSDHANAAFVKVLHQGIVRVICTAQHLCAHCSGIAACSVPQLYDLISIDSSSSNNSSALTVHSMLALSQPIITTTYAAANGKEGSAI